MESVLSERRGPVALITLNRPEQFNALDRATLCALEAHIEALRKDASVHALVITGNGRAFVAGADIGEMRGFDAAAARDFSRLGHRVFQALEDLEVPTIAAVNGYALGGGCELACACDFVYASEKARFGQPEVGLGIIPGFGATSRLARRVGIGWAKEMVLSGEPIRADVAQRIGLANRVFPPDELLAAAVSVGEAIARKGRLAVARAKRLLQDAQGVDPRAAHELEQTAFGLIFETEDQREGMDAYLEKRDPAFRGR